MMGASFFSFLSMGEATNLYQFLAAVHWFPWSNISGLALLLLYVLKRVQYVSLFYYQHILKSCQHSETEEPETSSLAALREAEQLLTGMLHSA